MAFVNLGDIFAESGKPDDLLRKYGLTYEAVTTNGKTNARWAALEKPLLNRAINAFHVNER